MSFFPAGEDEALLVAEIISGNRELFRLLIERHQQSVHAMGMGFFHNREDAADFTQDVFLKAYRGLSAFKGDSRFSTWLYSIAYNTAVNGIKRRREYRSLAEEEALNEASPESEALRGAVKQAVLDAVTDLPEKYRVCVDLYFFYGRSLLEIEKITGFPLNTVKSHLFRAKKLLREKLEEF
ncbi:MAG: sigma-70 family RNA polymerase sigma factor [Treponema sp.]|jgi:RNA polymerase sigma-70 factor (ECF subfamily)|nr:sigma-70 family RNA polymerase sigma factor [Treponema sp.]